MSTFSDIYFNGNLYSQMWLNDTKVWERDSSKIVYPYPDADCVITYEYKYSGSETITFDVIDSSLPYSINGVNTNKFTFYGMYKPTKIKLINLNPKSGYSTYLMNIEQLRLPNLTDLSYLFSKFCNYAGCLWSPQYFEFNENVTNMTGMFNYCQYLTDEMMAQFIPHFPNTSNVTNMDSMFSNCSSLTSLNLSNFDTSKVTKMGWMFSNCSSLTTLNLSSFDTSNITSTDYMFDGVRNCTIYISDKWTLDTSSTAYRGTNLTFVLVKPITNITLESTLTDTAILKGTQFTINPTIMPTDYSDDELVITYDTNSLSMVDNTFTVLDTATIGQQLDITYSSKKNPSVSTTYSVTIRDIVPITSITLTHTLEALVDVAIGTTFTVVPTVEPTIHEDELLVDYDTNQLSKNGDNYTVLSGANGQTVQVIYYSKHDNNINAILEFTVEKIKAIITTYTTFDKVSNSEYCSFTKDTETNAMTIKFTYTGSSYNYNTVWTKLDTILPRKCRIRITGKSQGTYRGTTNGYPTNNIMCLSSREYFQNYWGSAHSMPNDGIVYNNYATQTTSEALDYDEISLYQLNPNKDTLANDSINFYPFEYDFTYNFPINPILYLNYTTHYGGSTGKLSRDTYLSYKDLKIEVYENPIESIVLSTDEDINNIAKTNFIINSTILPSSYGDSDLEVVYDSTYMEINTNTGEVKLKDGCQGLTHTVTYRSKSDNSISKSITFTVSQDLEIGMDAIDFTQSTAPTLPDCMTLDGQGSSYYFSHGTYTTNVYGLVPNNSGKHSSTAYTRYKFVAPTNGALTFTYRCYAETNYDYLTVHVDTSTSQPSYSSSTNQVLTTYGVSSYQTTDGTASVNVTGGTTYYIHIQYRKDGSGNTGYDKGCIRKIELL